MLHPAPTDLKPYYLRGPDGEYTGDEYATEAEALAAASERPGCKAYRDLYVADNPAGWQFTGPHITLVPRPPRAKPRWGAWSQGDLA